MTLFSKNEITTDTTNAYNSSKKEHKSDMLILNLEV